jgi:hypothetical protein
MTTNIQLRYAASRHTTAEPPVLQYRVAHEVPTSSSILKTAIWDDWRDVPTVVIDTLPAAKGGE